MLLHITPPRTPAARYVSRWPLALAERQRHAITLLVSYTLYIDIAVGYAAG